MKSSNVIRLTRNNKHAPTFLCIIHLDCNRTSFNSRARLHHLTLSISSHIPLIRFHKLTRLEIFLPPHFTPCSCFSIPAQLLFQGSQLTTLAKLLIQSQNRVKHFFDVAEVDTLRWHEMWLLNPGLCCVIYGVRTASH